MSGKRREEGMRAIVQYVVWYESLTKQVFESCERKIIPRARKGLKENSLSRIVFARGNSSRYTISIADSND